MLNERVVPSLAHSPAATAAAELRLQGQSLHLEHRPPQMQGSAVDERDASAGAQGR
jgi:hypothetical protein